ncbi:hypothetical protein RCG24_20550 [Neobacillus sp. OS1-32]|uniref:hypothetical protein n=1 Tax=Neobacillus sp. OS1-32 TaxID=3070682 RepID=UPI0027DFC218|nr:hypothetical protein [Neobacillus sp. OS1-32]WML30240.1 hypothetical protein RCG24_20550 [Neobacillus sp. OS1-32]
MMDAARELERLERMKDPMQNFADGDKGTTRDKVAEQIGLGSGEQLRKAKFIADNADDETIAKLDEGASKRSNENVWHNATKNRRRTRNIDVPSNENVWHNATPTSYVTNSSQSRKKSRRYVKNFLNLSQFWAVFWVCIVNGEND